jgi:two-component system, cell cycle sensor histidine kinase and response regulator CckA
MQLPCEAQTRMEWHFEPGRSTETVTIPIGDFDEFRSLAENLPEIIARLDTNFRHLYINPAIESITGLPRSAYIGKTKKQMNLPSEFVELWDTYCERVMQTRKEVRFEFAFAAVTGIHYFQARIVPEWHNGEVVSLLSIATDMTEQHEIVAEAARIEALARLTGSIAHDFGNLIIGINGLASEIKSGADQAEIDQNVDEILSACEQSRALINQLLSFSRREELHVGPLRISDVLKRMQRMLKRLLGSHIELDVVISPSVSIECDRHQLEQIVMNLCLNARDSMPSGGRLTLRAGMLRRPALPHQHLIGDVVNYATLDVEDEGSGIDDAILPHVFDPFFTTKPAGQGTGLGLSTVCQLVKRYKGEIEVLRPNSRGTCFRICFPESKTVVA